MANRELLKQLDFEIAFGAIRHFGKNLYTTNPPAIAELVANGWDAYATECRILFNKNNELLISDNGIGMTDDEFQNRYARSGFVKDENIRIPKGMRKRPYMGKKGIGKFSAFSLGDTYELYTKSKEDSCWKKITLNSEQLNTNKAKVPVEIERIDDISSLLLKFAFNFYSETGTFIYIPNLKRNITDSTISSLKQLLPRRFSADVLTEYPDFKLYINNDNLDLTKHFFYSNVECVYSINYTTNDIKKKFPQIDLNNIIEKTPLNNQIKGWIASVDLPKTLRSEDGTRLTGVTIYINGKLADENILKNIIDDRVTNSYIIGEVNADYLENLEIDPVLSSREGLNQELENVIELRNYLKELRNELIDGWNEMRASRKIEKQDYITVAINKPVNKFYYEKLDENTKKRFHRYAQKLFDQPDPKNTQEKIIDILFSALIQIVNNEEFLKLLERENIEESELLSYIQKLFNITEINHSLRLRDGVKNKLSVISKLKEYIDNEEIESSFEDLLSKNPWLINPHWENHRTLYTQIWYTYLGIDNSDPERLRTDIIIEVSDERYPIIVELKRDKATKYSTPNALEVQNQIYKYRRAIAQKIKETEGVDVRADDIKSYFICGTKALYELRNNNSDMDLLNKNNIQIMSYETMINTSFKTLSVIYDTDLNEI